MLFDSWERLSAWAEREIACVRLAGHVIVQTFGSGPYFMLNCGTQYEKEFTPEEIKGRNTWIAWTEKDGARVSDLYAPVSGSVAEVNGRLAQNPEIINDDPYGDGWMVRVTMSNPAEVDQLMTAEQYRAFVAREKP